MVTQVSPLSSCPMMRTFIACAVPRPLREHLAGIQSRLRGIPLGLRWVKPENIHLTLKFLGDTPRHTVDQLREAVDRVAAGRADFTLQAGGLGVFPNLKRPRVLWVGLSGATASLAALHADLEQEAARVDAERFPCSRRPYRGHLTLGRARGRLSPAAVAQALKCCADFPSMPFVVDRVLLYRSELKPGGAEYTVLGEARFNAPNP